jgi:hypothetical protein
MTEIKTEEQIKTNEAGIALVAIQSQLECTKNNYNSFGRYSYRSCEDILSALKKLLREYNCFVIFEDEQIIEVSYRIYVKTTAVLHHPLSGTSVKSTAQAREPFAKKGMSEEQISGAASSYARKYALNALFAIDDTKDADYLNNGETKAKKSTVTKSKTYTPKKTNVVTNSVPPGPIILDTYSKKLDEAKDLKELQNIWDSFTKEQKLKYENQKNIIKDTLVKLNDKN